MSVRKSFHTSINTSINNNLKQYTISRSFNNNNKNIINQNFTSLLYSPKNIISYNYIRSFSSTPSTFATLNQVIKGCRSKKPPKRRSPNLGGCPQKKGVVLKLFVQKPKKPNSAQRKCCKVRLSNGKVVLCFIPGIGHNLQEHGIVLVRGGRVSDCPGIKYRVVRGAFDCQGVQGRIHSRSKYGTKKPKA